MRRRFFISTALLKFTEPFPFSVVFLMHLHIMYLGRDKEKGYAESQAHKGQLKTERNGEIISKLSGAQKTDKINATLLAGT